jgi:hypothetical protein
MTIMATHGATTDFIVSRKIQAREKRASAPFSLAFLFTTILCTSEVMLTNLIL